MNDFGFYPACENEGTVFGAERPGYPFNVVSQDKVREWITFMRKQGITRVCCLLSCEQLHYYKDGLLTLYSAEFGEDNTCWAPVEDFYLCDAELLKEKILPFLKESDAKREKVVVHCSAGIGRTGLILAAWLVSGRGFSVEEALSAVKKTGRNPLEAVEYGTASKRELYDLLL